MKTVLAQVSLVAPELFARSADQLQWAGTVVPKIPTLERILSRATVIRHPEQGYEYELLRLLCTGSPESVAVGALSYHAKQQAKAGAWYMRADPVHLKADRDHLVMLGNVLLGITPAEAGQLVADINRTFAQEPWRLELINPTQWVLESNRNFDLTTHKLTEVIGRSISSALPGGADARYWRVILNEVQMFLHNHNVNSERVEKGLPMINSLWLWGEGRFTTPCEHIHPAEIWSEDAFARGLAALYQLPSHLGVPGSLRVWLRDVQHGAHHIIILDAWGRQFPSDTADSWQRMLSHLEVEYAQPLLEALKQRKLSRVRLLPCQGLSYELTLARLRQWWKPAKSITTYLS